MTVGEELLCEHELTNLYVRYAVAACVAVIKDENVIWRLFTAIDKCDGPSLPNISIST